MIVAVVSQPLSSVKCGVCVKSVIAVLTYWTFLT